ncbi:MAG: ABC transporter permease [Chloroflexota bacterium]
MGSTGSSKARLAPETGWALAGAVCVLLAVILWQWLSDSHAISPIFYPPPTRVAQTLANWITTGKLQTILMPTLMRLGVGCSLGSLAGYAFGIAIGYSRSLYRLFDPIISLIYPIPKIALLPLIFVIFGFGDSSRQIVIGAVALFPVAINAATGVRAINANYFAIAQVYGAPLPTVFRRILLPGSLPMTFSGLRIAFNSAFVATIAVELAAANDGIGHAIWLAWQTLRTEELYAGLLLVVVVGLLCNSVLRILERIFVRWQS